MAIDPTCIHGYVVRWCSLCRTRPQGKCSICNQELKPGDVLTSIMPSGETVHEYCL